MVTCGLFSQGCTVWP